MSVWLAGLLIAPGLGAQTVPAVDHPTSPGDSLTVYLVTMGPGEQVWERFGHNAIWIHDPRTGEDVVWNWGLFSFSQAGFIPRLARGEMMYWMGGFSLGATLAEYEAAGRPVWAQELALTPAQELELDRLIRENARPENVYYRYDYYRDNCSTRVRDMLDAVLGGGLRAAFEPQETGVTWRWHTLRLLDEAPLPRAGVQIVLGNPGDEAIDRWQEMFLPMRLRAAVAEASVPDPEGRARPLVVREIRLLEGQASTVPAEPRSRVVGWMLVGMLLAGVLVGLASWGARGSRAGRRITGLALGTWGAASGLVGLVLAVAYLTDHVFWYANENLLQASPLHLLVGVGGVSLFFRPTAPKWAVPLAVALAAFAVLGLVLKPVPGLDQGNLDVVAFAVPLNLAAAWAFSRLARRPGDGSGTRAAELRAAD